MLYGLATANKGELVFVKRAWQRATQLLVYGFYGLRIKLLHGKGGIDSHCHLTCQIINAYIADLRGGRQHAAVGRAVSCKKMGSLLFKTFLAIIGLSHQAATEKKRERQKK